MKKFITSSAYQMVMPKEGEEIMLYTAAETAPKLHCQVADEALLPYFAGFPLLYMVNAFVGEGEEFQVIALTTESDAINTWSERNFDNISAAVKKLAESKKSTAKVIKVQIPVDESIDTHLRTFGELVELIGDDDTLYADITYGNKTAPILQFMALNYGYQCKGAVIDCVCYGEARFLNKEKTIKRKRLFDVTSLFHMQQITNTLGKLNATNPLATIQAILNLNEHADEEVKWEDEDNDK